MTTYNIICYLISCQLSFVPYNSLTIWLGPTVCVIWPLLVSSRRWLDQVKSSSLMITFDQSCLKKEKRESIRDVTSNCRMWSGTNQSRSHKKLTSSSEVDHTSCLLVARQNKARWDPGRSIFDPNELNSEPNFMLDFGPKWAQFWSRLWAQFWTDSHKCLLVRQNKACWDPESEKLS